MYIKYPAPKYLIMSKASDELWMSNDTPVAAKAVWTKIPDDSPSASDTPFFLPPEILSVNTKILSGPGINVKATEAIKKEITRSKFNVFYSFLVHLILIASKVFVFS